MASISSLGVGSGLDLSSIVTGLVNAERAPVENRLSAKEQDLQLELSSFGVLRSSLTVFQERLEGLQSSSTYNAKEISVSDEAIFSASVENSADLGNYTVEVSALATKHSLATNAAAAFNDINDVIGTGTLNIRFGATSTGPYSFTPDLSKATQSITISEANNNNTLSGLRDYINNNDLGIQASIVDDGTGYRMVLTSEKTGANNSMEITVAGDGDGNNNDNSGLSQLAFNASAQSSVIQTVAAQDAALSINGLDITRDSNTVSGAINGVTLNLLRADVGNFVNVDITENRDEIKNTIEGFVKGYNGVVNSINSLTNFDPESGSAGALIGDFTVRSISSQLRNIMYTSVSGLTGNISSLIDIGIKTGLDGKMEIDTSKLDEALTNFPSEVEALFALQGRPTDTNISYSSASEDTIPGEYGINISTIATRAIFNGTAVNSLTIDANNDNFEIVVNGVSSSQISLVQGLYSDGDELAAHIQAQINNDANLKDAGVSVVVDFDGINNEFDIISSEYGSNSSIEITSVDINTANDLGLNAGIGISGNNVAGTINGNSAIGNGQILTSQIGNSDGLAIKVNGGALGDRGTISFSRGIADQLNNLLDRFLEQDGFISSREEGINEELDEISDERLKLDFRIESLEARLIKQFTALDGLIAQFNSTSAFLTQQLANLPKPNSINNNN